MVYEELNIFDCLYENYKINKPIKLIELFIMELNVMDVEFSQFVELGTNVEFAIISISAKNATKKSKMSMDMNSLFFLQVTL